MAWAFWELKRPFPGQGNGDSGRLAIWARRAMTLLEGPTPVVKPKGGGGSPAPQEAGSTLLSAVFGPGSSQGDWARLWGVPGVGMGWVSASFTPRANGRPRQEGLFPGQDAPPPAAPAWARIE
ncbi:hypothetical protein GWK47_047419 [Chionoecetes opilio]|uniref:Uncharacterized protein n=1 Tax=Chionoecetes opilio TaxID=41210 RepID=A0A8J4YCW8_CHIOP|nr:hypothetical protein GWK47_047419 [Chionoecetes opilio]